MWGASFVFGIHSSIPYERKTSLVIGWHCELSYIEYNIIWHWPAKPLWLYFSERRTCWWLHHLQVIYLSFSGLLSSFLARCVIGICVQIDNRMLVVAFAEMLMSFWMYQVPTALHMAMTSKEGDDHELIEKIKLDKDRYNAVIECYESLKVILLNLLLDYNDKK